jgi:SRSO17 transposase
MVPLEERQMEPRFIVRKCEMLQDCQVQADWVEGISRRLHEFVQPFTALLGRVEQRKYARVMLEGLLSDLPRKTSEPIAYRHDRDRGDLQYFMGASPWDPAPLRRELTVQVAAALGEGDGVLVFDPSSHRKQGKHSVGVARQWCGRLGKIDNCQVGIYLGYASRKGHALVDVALYLPKEWTRDRKRMRACGVPREVRHRTRHKMAVEMLREKGPLLPHGWVTGDDEMGRPIWFRRKLHDLGERYLLAVPSNTTIRDLEGEEPVWSGHGRKPLRRWEPVATWCAALDEQAWTKIDVRDGEKGPLVVECIKRRVRARTEERRVGPEELLFVTRTREEDGTWKHDYYLSDAIPRTPLEELARVAKAEHRIEECFERAKGEAGLSQYELRSWLGWYHHQTLALVAAWFLTLEATRGKKPDACADGAADGFHPGVGALGFQSRSGEDWALRDAATEAQRVIALA